jgi:uncharacterized protein
VTVPQQPEPGVTADLRTGVSDRIAEFDWEALTEALDRQGFAQTAALYDRQQCERLTARFEDGNFRSTIDMRRYRFGEGEYKYFDSPLPDLIDDARHALYSRLTKIANQWAENLGECGGYPAQLDAFLQRCHRAGQTRPTPLMLRYFEGGHNTLHQDLYGELAFPLQAVTVLNRPGEDFQGGQFVLLEQRPRAQSRAHVIDLEQGAFLVFPTRLRPVLGSRGYYRTTMRHGVATVRSGQRITLGIIFHDAA